MFGNNQDNGNDQHDQPAQEMNAGNGFGAPQDNSVPTMPTMGGQPPAFGAPQPTQPDPPAPEPTNTPMLAEEGTPDPQPEEQQQMPQPPTNDLVDIKQQALQHLSPLVSHLDQTPDEKFRTTMMMIQATDDHSLLKQAFESAQKIEDDKARAQALLDVINEINYFTQQHNS